MTLPINLDKLRNTVQSFGSLTFTTAQVLHDYSHGDPSPSDPDKQQFESLLHRHATLLGIQAQPSSAGGDTVWQAGS